MYEVILQRQPKHYFARCDKPTAERLAACLESLEQDPFLPGSKALKGKLQGTRRCRVGSLRVVYEVDEDSAVVSVLAILPRGEVYKKK
ncbi:MAG: type II toxin-antitoxin system RelE/ParE family toxin [Deltaproteobacteria bacterium]|nr:type II toxin-antitoxin system RelE/ParE family toxin [Deltaproteobacteria bacterium]